MERKCIKIVTIFVVGLCSILLGNFSVKADSSKDYIQKWCYADWKGGASSVSKYFAKFSEVYKLDDWKNIDKNACYGSGELVVCNFEKKTNGYYMLAVSTNGNTQYVYPDKNGVIKFTTQTAPGSEIALYSYPVKVVSGSIDNHKIKDVCKVNGYNNDIFAEKDINGNLALFSVWFSTPSSKTNTFPNKSICKSFVADVKRKYSKYTDYAKTMVPECYDKKYDVDIFTTESDVSYRIQTFKQIVSQIKNADVSNTHKDSDLFCQFNKYYNKVKSSLDKNSVIKSHTTVTHIKDTDRGWTWYDLVCIEDMEIEYDSPKASYSSGGFKYTVKLSSKKSCSVIPIRTPQRPTICLPSITFTDTNTANGGPSEDFDACVNKCDGGLYSDKCSESCFEKVYKQNKKAKNITFNSNDSNKFSDVVRLLDDGYITNSNKKGWCYVEDVCDPPDNRQNRKCETGTWNWIVCPSAKTMAAGESGTLELTPTSVPQRIPANVNGDVYGCVYGFQSEICRGTAVCDNNCSPNSVETKWQQDEEYETQVNLQKEAKGILNSKYKCKEKNGGWVCEDKITTKEATENATITRVVNNVNKDIVFEGNSQPSVSYTENNKYSFINFPKAFISLENGSVLYKNQTSINMLGYRYGGYLFYTDPDTTSENSNDIRYYPYNASSYGITNNIIKDSGLNNNSKYGPNNTLINWNIVTNIKNFGSDKQWNIDVNCFYGADVSLCGKDDPDCCEAGGKCEPVECKDCVSGNLPYRYRTVNLDDLFPDDREAGYNWTNNVANKKASVNGYIIDPESLISDIESKGNSIYNSTPYSTLSIGKNGYNWNDVKNDGSLYTNFDGNYSTLTNGVNFYNSKYVSNHQKTNRTK